jgi:hypothetical protein
MQFLGQLGSACIISQNWTIGRRVALHLTNPHQEDRASVFGYRTLQEGIPLPIRKA